MLSHACGKISLQQLPARAQQHTQGQQGGLPAVLIHTTVGVVLVNRRQHWLPAAGPKPDNRATCVSSSACHHPHLYCLPDPSQLRLCTPIVSQHGCTTRCVTASIACTACAGLRKDVCCPAAGAADCCRNTAAGCRQCDMLCCAVLTMLLGPCGCQHGV